ncbi:isoprenyl transferase [Bacteroidia bacterium]|nr:isoprenyl transferase [Bacteroidia bacterium]
MEEQIANRLSQIDKARVPRHIVVIMDGNGRWAQKNGMDRYFGHQEGVVSLHKMVETAGDLGVQYLTAYTFSTENWKRPQEEVDALMALVVIAIERETPGLMKNNVRLLAIGDIDRLPQDTRNSLQACINATSKNTGLTFIIALSYSARWEITEMVKAVAQEVKAGELAVEDITEDVVSAHLTTAGIPDPDLLIRTGGEHRISNYLLWQLAYSELYFSDVYWPEFREEHLYEAILDYQKRERRFGKTGEQIKLNK